MIVLTNQGNLITGVTSDSVVNHLRQSGFMGFAMSRKRYMQCVALWIKRRDKYLIRIDTSDHFLLDMDRNGYLSIRLADS